MASRHRSDNRLCVLLGHAKFCLGHVWSVHANWMYHDTFGAAHLIPVAVSTWSSTFGCGGGPPGSGTATATDSSGYTATVSTAPSARETARSGAIINAPLQAGTGSDSVIDSNGNEVTVTATKRDDYVYGHLEHDRPNRFRLRNALQPSHTILDKPARWHLVHKGKLLRFYGRDQLRVWHLRIWRQWRDFPKPCQQHQPA